MEYVWNAEEKILDCATEMIPLTVTFIAEAEKIIQPSGVKIFHEEAPKIHAIGRSTREYLVATEATENPKQYGGQNMGYRCGLGKWWYHQSTSPDTEEPDIAEEIAEHDEKSNGAPGDIQRFQLQNASQKPCTRVFIRRSHECSEIQVFK